MTSLLPRLRRATTLTLAASLLGALGAAPASAQTIRVATANVDFTSSAKAEQAQIKHVLRAAPDVVLLQETRETDLRTVKQRDLPKLQDYRIIQFWDAGPFQRASTVLVSKARFNVGETGLSDGYADRPRVDPPARYLPWAVATDAVTGRHVAFVSVHMPKSSLTRRPFADAYRTMSANYAALVTSFAQRGLPVITGGDWNQSVRKPNRKVDFDPLDTNGALGLQFNWAFGKPCASTHRSDVIDGLAFSPGSLAIGAQRCLPRFRSDHKPVVADFAFR